MDNIFCSECENFEYHDRRIEGKATPEHYGYCKEFKRQTSADSFYAVCLGASPIDVHIEKPSIVKKRP